MSRESHSPDMRRKRKDFAVKRAVSISTAPVDAQYRLWQLAAKDAIADGLYSSMTSVCDVALSLRRYAGDPSLYANKPVNESPSHYVSVGDFIQHLSDISRDVAVRIEVHGSLLQLTVGQRCRMVALSPEADAENLILDTLRSFVREHEAEAARGATYFPPQPVVPLGSITAPSEIKIKLTPEQVEIVRKAFAYDSDPPEMKPVIHPLPTDVLRSKEPNIQNLPPGQPKHTIDGFLTQREIDELLAGRPVSVTQRSVENDRLVTPDEVKESIDKCLSAERTVSPTQLTVDPQSQQNPNSQPLP